MTDDARRGANRREFLAAGAVTAMTAQAASAQGPARPPAPVELPTMKAGTEMQAGPLPAPLAPDKRLGFAIVGLGELALGEVLPAFGQCKFARPTALVSGDRAKAEKVAAQYGIGREHLYDYTTFDRLAGDSTVDVIDTANGSA